MYSIFYDIQVNSSLKEIVCNVVLLSRSPSSYSAVLELRMFFPSSPFSPDPPALSIFLFLFCVSNYFQTVFANNL